jgi:hypothetical protein
MKNVSDVIKTYGGYNQFLNDNNCCAVTALSASMEVPYDEAFKYAQQTWGRKGGEGTKTLKLLQSFVDRESITVGGVTKKITKVGNTHVYHQYGKDINRKMSIKSFLKMYPTGTYYILMRSHAFTVKNGELIDNSDRMGRRITHVWKLD